MTDYTWKNGRRRPYDPGSEIPKRTKALDEAKDREKKLSRGSRIYSDLSRRAVPFEIVDVSEIKEHEGTHTLHQLIATVPKTDLDKNLLSAAIEEPNGVVIFKLEDYPADTATVYAISAERKDNLAISTEERIAMAVKEIGFLINSRLFPEEAIEILARVPSNIHDR